jgi:tRNA(adenine34) deaminase
MNDEDYMQVALSLAQQAAQNAEVPVGAIVVKHGEIIGRGYNQPIAKHDPSAHAEMLAIREAATLLGNYRLVDCELFVTLEPCVMCLGAIFHARISRVIFGAHDPKTGACGSAIDLTSVEKLNHHTTITANICSEECGKILSDFFKQRRLSKKNI